LQICADKNCPRLFLSAIICIYGFYRTEVLEATS